MRYSGASACDLAMNAAWVSPSRPGGGSVRDVTGTPIAMKNSSCPDGVHMHNKPCCVACCIAEAVRRVSRYVDGLAGSGQEVLAPEAELHLAFEDGEHLLEVVTVRRGAAPGWDMHVDEGVLAGGVSAAHQNRVGVSDEAEVREALVCVGTCHGQVSLGVVAWYRWRRRCRYGFCQRVLLNLCREPACVHGMERRYAKAEGRLRGWK